MQQSVDVGAAMWKLLTPYVVGTIVSMTAALVLWIIKTFNKHSDSVKDILFILVGVDGKNGLRSEVKKMQETCDTLAHDITVIKTTLKI